MTPRTRHLLRQAKNVEDLGKRSAAEKLFRELLVEAPDEPEALLGLARLTHDKAEQTATLERILEIEPKHEQAQAGLAGNWPPAAAAPVITAPPTPEAAPSDILQDRVVELPDMQTGIEMDSAETHVHSADTEVGLTCNRCGKAIDPKTAVHTPVGYRCKECVRELEDTKYYTSRPLDYVIAVLVALPISLLVGYFVQFVGFFVIFLAAGTGTFIGTLTSRAIGKRRGRYIPTVVAVCVAIGGLAPMILGLLFAFLSGGLSGFNFLRFISIWAAVYAFIASGSAYVRLK